MPDRDPDQIRSEIEDTREQLGETVEALAGKADVKGQAKAKVEDTKDRLRTRAEDARTKLGDASPEGAKGAASSAADSARERPLPFAAGGAFVAGLVVGLLIGRRR